MPIKIKLGRVASADNKRICGHDRRQGNRKAFTMSRLIFLLPAIFLIIACAKPVDPDLVAAVRANKMSKAAAVDEQGRRDSLSIAAGSRDSAALDSFDGVPMGATPKEAMQVHKDMLRTTCTLQETLEQTFPR